MADDFFLDPDGLSEGSREMREHGHVLNEAYLRLKGMLDVHYGCWGNDEVGKSFAKNYVPGAEKFTTGGQQVGAALPSLADDIDESSTTFQSVDEDNARQIDRTTDCG